MDMYTNCSIVKCKTKIHMKNLLNFLAILTILSFGCSKDSNKVTREDYLGIWFDQDGNEVIISAGINANEIHFYSPDGSGISQEDATVDGNNIVFIERGQHQVGGISWKIIGNGTLSDSGLILSVTLTYQTGYSDITDINNPIFIATDENDTSYVLSRQ